MEEPLSQDWPSIASTQPFEGDTRSEFSCQDTGASGGRQTLCKPCVQAPRRCTYLITYSQADLEKVPTREAFASLVLEAFASISNLLVESYAVAMEPHRTGGQHYHMSVKLSRQVGFLGVGQFLRKRHGVQVNFSTNHPNYYTAYDYVAREDPGFIRSPGHREQLVPPRTGAASQRRQKSKEGERGKAAPPAPKRLRREEVAKIIVEKQLCTGLDLMAYATTLKRENEDDRLYNFIISLTMKRGAVESLVEGTWRLENAVEERKRLSKSRLDVLKDAARGMCICRDRWKHAAAQILDWNDIPHREFLQAVLEALRKGRAKETNLMLIGRANCGKTFLLMPLTKIYKCFESPASGSFAWVGVENKEVVFLNDYRWTAAQFPWANFLAFLEGATTHIAVPKTSRDKDIEFTKDVPVFATAQAKVQYSLEQPKQHLTEDDFKKLRDEQQMMDDRWRIFELKHRIEQREDIAACAACFAQFILA